MSIIITNVTPDIMPDDQPYDYVLRINQREITRFQHVRDRGLAECLKAAAAAVEITDNRNDRRG